MIRRGTGAHSVRFLAALKRAERAAERERKERDLARAIARLCRDPQCAQCREYRS